MAGEKSNRLSWHLPDSFPGWLLESGTGWLRWLPPEASRKATLAAFDLLGTGWLPGGTPVGANTRDWSGPFWADGLRVSVPGFGDLPHPVGLAAGWCRDGRHLKALDTMGFAFAEIGSFPLAESPASVHGTKIRRDTAARTMQVTAAVRARSGSADSTSQLEGAVGKLSTSGAASAAISLEVPLALSDVRCVAATISALARISSAAAINAGGSRIPVVLSFAHGASAQRVDGVLEALGAGGALVTNPFLWIKIGPGWSRHEFQNVIETMADLGYQGLVAGSSRSVTWPEPAMLSGAPAFAASNQLLEWAWAVHKGALPMIASGGVTNGEEAFQKILRGACAVEVMSALWLRGPFAARLVCAELHAESRRFGARSITELAGVFYEDF
jgi:dihydroorotate dehydrogenase